MLSGSTSCRRLAVIFQCSVGSQILGCCNTTSKNRNQSSSVRFLRKIRPRMSGISTSCRRCSFQASTFQAFRSFSDFRCLSRLVTIIHHRSRHQSHVAVARNTRRASEIPPPKILETTIAATLNLEASVILVVVMVPSVLWKLKRAEAKENVAFICHS